MQWFPDAHHPQPPPCVSHATQSPRDWHSVDPGHSPASGAQSLPDDDISADCRMFIGSAEMHALPRIVQPQAMLVVFIAAHAAQFVAPRQPA
jgi:hypothetical protein